MVLKTGRLTLRQFTLDDAAFIVGLLNQPSFIKNIGDKGVRNCEDASGYLRDGPIASYRQYGFGLLMTELHDGTPIGMCGLIKRDELDDPDVGYAFLPDYWGCGYASESAAAVVAYGREQLGLSRIIAITTPDNEGSNRVLRKIGLQLEGLIVLSDEQPANNLYATLP